LLNLPPEFGAQPARQGVYSRRSGRGKKSAFQDLLTNKNGTLIEDAVYS